MSEKPHQHSDHNADYGNLIWLAWAAGLSTRVDSWGPPPLPPVAARVHFRGSLIVGKDLLEI